MVPPAGFKPTSYALEERCLIQLDHGGMLLFILRLLYYPLVYNDFDPLSIVINIYVKIYENLTPTGLHIHLSYEDGVCCIMVQDIYDNTYFEMQYFTNVNKALRWVNNL